MKRVLRALAVGVSCLIACPVFAGSADVIRESTGQRRIDLDKMELKPFPMTALSGLTDWTNGDALKPSDLDGKPVLLVNWASWNQGSVRALSLAQRMGEKFAASGLVVIGIHHPQGWEGAAEAAKGKGATFRIACDKDGAYRKALKVDHEPEYYVIDRAGHLRYASVLAGSVEEALTEVTEESAQKAGDVPRLLTEREEASIAQGKKTTDIRENFELQTLPPVPPGYSQPTEIAYKAVKWPKMEKETGKAFGLLDNDENPLEPKLAFQPIAWHPKKPETTGRVQVIYFWHPDLHATYSPTMDFMDKLQEQHLRDVAVIGALIGQKVMSPDTGNRQNSEEETFDKLKKKYDSFVGSRHYNHALAVDIAMTCLAGLNAQQGSHKFPVPGAMIVSTDGTVRWIGWTIDNLGRTNPDFKAALDNVLSKDPGIRARRAADLAYIENHKK